MDIKKIIENISYLIDPNSNSESNSTGFLNVVNIATLSDGDEFLEQKSSITLSIVNIQEDRTLKNQSIYQKKTEDNTIDKYAHPAKCLIFSILFASYNIDQSKYLLGLERLQTVINFFQQNNSFFYKTAGTNINEVITFLDYAQKSDTEKEDYSKITFMSVSLNIDQTNQMWSYLGSKYMPSVLYEMRILPIQNSTIETIGRVEKIEIKLWENDKKDPVGLIETSNDLEFELDENGKTIEVQKVKTEID